jgi:hypothetical protein
MSGEDTGQERGVRRICAIDSMKPNVECTSVIYIKSTLNYWSSRKHPGFRESDFNLKVSVLKTLMKT